MKKVFIASIFALAVVLVSCGEERDYEKVLSTANIDPENPPIMTWADTTYDFGTISQGQIVKYNFEFTNTGKSDLVIQSANGSCGCTVPKNWPTEPIAPGESGKVEVNFNSEYKSGKQNVTVTVLANTVPTKNVVRLTGVVNAPETEAE